MLQKNVCKGRNLLLRDVNLIPENCEAFNGRGVLISQNAHLVARTFLGHLYEHEHGAGGGLLPAAGPLAAASSVAPGGIGMDMDMDMDLGVELGVGLAGLGGLGGGSYYSSYGGGADDVCPACGVRFEGGIEGGVALVSCQACNSCHHAICVVDGAAWGGGSPQEPWVCVACGREN